MIQAIRYLKRGLVNAQWRMVEAVCDFNPQQNFIVSSDPRGGSNWIAEAIAQIPKTAILLEPLHLGRPSRFKELGFGWRQYIPESATWEEARHAFRQVFRGKALRSGSGVRTSALDFIRANRMIIKFCRVKAMLPWLTRNFAFTYAPVNLVRHPGAVVASQMQYGAPGWTNEDFQGFVMPDCPYNEFYTRHADFLATITTKEEEMTAVWCLTNLVPLQHARNNTSWITVYYENLLMNPEPEIQRIFQCWGLPVPQSIWDQLQKPSATTKDATFQQSTEAQLAKWRSFFTADQLARIENVLNYFEVTTYTLDNVVPHVAVASDGAA